MGTTTVAPLVGAWIEIVSPFANNALFVVAPLVGAWIEIAMLTCFCSRLRCRSPRGSVD